MKQSPCSTGRRKEGGTLSAINRGNGPVPAGPQPVEQGAGANVPDWSAVPFEVPCGRCGADLAGQGEPLCPDCGLTFDWDDALPIERLRCQHCNYQVFGLTVPRCPECGQSFKWSDVLAAARSRSNRLFENQWYRNPLPSLARTWFLAMCRPRKLWSLYDLHDAPRLVPLVLFVLVQWLIFARGWQALALLADWSMGRLTEALNSNISFVYRFWPGRGFFTHMALWWLMTFVALQLFVQSKRLYKVRWQHVLRVYVHATVFASPLLMVWMLAEWAIDLGLLVVPALRPVSQLTYLRIGQVLFGLGLVATWVQLWIGYRCYLRVPRGWGVAALAMLLGHLLASLVEIYL